MKRIIAIFSLLLLLGACQSSTVTNVEKIENKIVYFKDARTGLCFATLNSKTYGGSQVTSITCVPCEALNNVQVTVLNQK